MEREFQKQKAKGGIIDRLAEDSRFLVVTDSSRSMELTSVSAEDPLVLPVIQGSVKPVYPHDSSRLEPTKPEYPLDQCRPGAAKPEYTRDQPRPPKSEYTQQYSRDQPRSGRGRWSRKPDTLKEHVTSVPCPANSSFGARRQVEVKDSKSSREAHEPNQRMRRHINSNPSNATHQLVSHNRPPPGFEPR